MEKGVIAPTFERSLIKQMMNEVSKETWLLADFSEFNKRVFSKSCSLNDIDGTITDDTLEDYIKEEYRAVIPML